MNKWTVITVTYNNSAELLNYWGGAQHQPVDWIVVDNASADGSAALAGEMGAEVISLGANVGFSAANNVGLRYVRTPYVAFVNPDVQICAGNWMSRFEALLNAGHLDIVAPQLINVDGTTQNNARGVPYLASKVAHRLFPDRAREWGYVGTASQVSYCTWLMGAAICSRTSTIRAMGGWDERYFLYYEDHDLCLRGWSNGLKVGIDPTVEWIHEWKRETSSFAIKAWKAELRSMLKFYATYPDLLLWPASGGASGRKYGEQSWTAVELSLPEES